MTFDIRAEGPKDQKQIHQVVWSAFSRPGEAELVRTIRSRQQSLISLVALWGDLIVGHVLLSPVTVARDFKAVTTSGNFAGIAPLSVLPQYQRQGVGSALMRATIAASRDLGLSALFLLGEPNYYGRFGFSRSHLANEYGATTAFMQLELIHGTLASTQGMVRYVSAFNEELPHE
jgi:putative acetyltransferase